jgi:UDP-N-acetylmuramoyl-tripeptide--D-alanyl-D-alanine ligase
MTAEFTLAEIVQATGGRVCQRGAGKRFVGITTDSRIAQTGQIFLPLRGDKFDGHNFIPGALSRGIGALVVAESWHGRHNPSLPPELAVVLVPDTLRALGDLAHFWRLKFSCPVIAITGSCGKTTTKEMVARVLGRKFTVLKNELNLNNLIGMPQTLLGLTKEHEVAVVECGMNQFGEIRRLSHIAQPDIAVLTNVHAAHLAGLGSIQGVARAKSEIIDGLRPNGILIYNSDDPWLQKSLSRFHGRTLTLGFGAAAQVRALASSRSGLWGQTVTISHRSRTFEMELHLPGPHQLYNALAAAALGLTLGISPQQISSGLAQIEGLENRSQFRRLDSGLLIYNDCYNANPGSMTMALQTLATLKNHGKSMAALGDMLELGQTTAQAHKEIGALAAHLNVDLLILCGKYRHLVREGALAAGMSAARIHAVPSHAAAAQIVKEFCRAGDTLLVKGSRGAHMENLLSFLQDG